MSDGRTLGAGLCRADAEGVERTLENDAREQPVAASRREDAQPDQTTGNGRALGTRLANSGDPSGGLSVGQLVSLQQQAGNTAVSSLLRAQPGSGSPDSADEAGTAGGLAAAHQGAGSGGGQGPGAAGGTGPGFATGARATAAGESAAGVGSAAEAASGDGAVGGAAAGELAAGSVSAAVGTAGAGPASGSASGGGAGTSLAGGRGGGGQAETGGVGGLEPVRGDRQDGSAAAGEESGGGAGTGPAAGLSDGDLISTELAEHERWAASFGGLGVAGSDERTRYLLNITGQGAASGAAGGLVMGFMMSAITSAVTQVVTKRLATMAVSRGLSATPVPGLGPAIGGVVALVGLARRDWGATGKTIDKIGTGTGYERLANDLEGIAEILDVATAVMDVVGGVLGGIAVGMWVAAVLSAGVLSPLAGTLSMIAGAIGIANLAIGMIINAVIRPTVVALRALHAFESQGDPAQVEQQSQQLSAAAGQVTGAVAGALAAKVGGRVGEKAGDRIDGGITKIQERMTGGTPTPNASTGEGPRLHAEVPEAPADRDTVPAPAPDGTSPTTGDRDTLPMPAPDGSPPSSGDRDTLPIPAPDGSPPSGDRDTLPMPAPADRDTIPSPPPDSGPLSGDRDTVPLPAPAAPPPAAPAPAAPAPAAPAPAGGPDSSGPLRPIQADVEIKGDFSDAALSPVERRNHGDAEVGDIGRHRHQGARGDTMISEHVIPGAQIRDATTDPATGVADWQRTTASGNADGKDYRGATTIVENRAVSDHKTRLDNAATAALQAKGGPQNLVDDLLLPSLDRHQQATDLAIAQGQITPAQATDPTHRALAAQAEMWGDSNAARRPSGQSNLPPGADIDDFDSYDWDATFNKPAPDTPAAGPAPSAPGPAPASPAPVTSTAVGTPATGHPDHTQTAVTADRGQAMAQYHAQVSGDPARESGVWRDADGNYFVMQGGPGSVAPPAGARQPAELIYHSHPVSANPAQQNLNTQASQAGGDFGVLQHQHGQGPVGKAQTSNLHFPVYDATGRHVGYGETKFVYDPTHPLPLQVTTTSPGGSPATQRYASYGDYQQRAGVGASGATPAQAAANLAQGQARLQQDQAQARTRIKDTARQLNPGGPLTVGIREGREQGRQWGTGQAGTGGGGLAGPAYNTAVVLRPGEVVTVPVNPPYESPPGTKAEIAALRERIAISRAAQEDLTHTENRMNAQSAVQRGHEAQLVQAGEVSQQLVAGGQAQATATTQTRTTNQQQQSTAGEAIDTLGKSAKEAGAVATLVVSLRGFQGLAHLFGYLPGDLGGKARNATKDVDRLITSLDRVRDTEAAKGQVQGQRQAIQGNQQRIDQVAQQNQQTAGELEQGRQQVDQLRQKNQDRLAETESTRDQAQQERQIAANDEASVQAQHDDLQTRMQEWAAKHQDARTVAINLARARLMAQGYRTREAQ